MGEINILVPSVSIVSISGKDKQRINFKHVEAKSEASKCGGRILRDVELSDGFFMEVLFETPEMKEFWEIRIGAKK